MPRILERRTRVRASVKVNTQKECGVCIRCQQCHYEGAADIVTIKRWKRPVRSMQRCPACKSLNIIGTEVKVNMEEKDEWEIDEWKGCYPSQWKGMIVPDAMAHPAKFSSRLIRRIYDHLFEEGWAQEGDRVVDPFGGVALGALNAMEKGLGWCGCELEAKFVEMGIHNISNWNIKFKAMPHWSGQAVLLQGDSRRLLQVVTGQADVAVSSPPFTSSEGSVRANKFGDPEKFAEEKERLYREGKIKGNFASKEAILKSMEKVNNQEYGHSEGQMANMKATVEGFDVSISSPPFRQSEGGTPEPKPGGSIDERLYARHAAGNGNANGYGVSDGQLANMKEGDFDVSISSPPFERTGVLDHKGQTDNLMNGRFTGGGDGFLKNEYGDSTGNIGNDSGDEFWTAARQIVDQVYMALRPGGHAVWVCKDFVRNKERVPFSDQWRQLCEAAGFVTVHQHLALLVRSRGKSLTLDGGIVEHSTSSKSFFRRLAESKGSPRIDWEVVWCMEKPL